MNSIKALIIDNSAVGRAVFTDLLCGLKNLEIVATAMEPLFAVKKIERLRPDLLIINSNITQCRGMEDLFDAIRKSQLPVILIISEEEKSDDSRWRIDGAGRIEILTKREDDDNLFKFRETVIEKISLITDIKVEIGEGKINVPHKPEVKIRVMEKFTADIILPRTEPSSLKTGTEKLIVIGASTGGTELIEEILSSIPQDIPGIVIVLHLPGRFTGSYAKRINTGSKLLVKEGDNGDLVKRGIAIIAPGNRHMLLRNSRDGYKVEINDGPHVNRHKPSIDVLFRSACQSAGKNCIGILCTGMGYDGARGLLEIREAGGLTIAQDEASSIVFGMPREAINLGAAEKVLSVKGIIDYIKSLQLN